MVRDQSSRDVRIAGALGVLAFMASCSGGPPAGALAKAPDFVPKGETKCSVSASQSEPLVVEWPSAERGRLETQARKGLVVVRYSGCEMKVLPECSARGAYQYAPLTTKRDRVKIANADDLYANLPAHAVKFEATLKRSGELNVAMTIVGRFEAERAEIVADELAGDCAGATHVLGALTVGAFDFFAGAESAAVIGGEVGGFRAGGRSTAERETLAQDGDDAACGKAARGDTQPPDGCGALLRVEVVPIGKPRCPAGTRQQGDGCVAVVSTTCPAGLRFEKGIGCVDARPKATGDAAARGIAPAAVVPMVRVVGAGSVGLFSIDQTEVTLAAYEACVGTGACSREELNYEYACNWGERSRADHPINCVSGAQAAAYCQWLGKRLPTDAEWTRAAFGEKGRVYPWGDSEPFSTGSIAVAPCWAGVPNDAPGGKRESSCAVKSSTKDVLYEGSEAVHGLAANVREWTATLNGAERVVRGGGWRSTALAALGSGARTSLPEGRRANDVGFRCVK